MYFKVALIVGTIVLFSGCSNPFGPKPSNPKNNKNLGVEVVEEVSQESRATTHRQKVKTVQETPVKENSKVKTKTKTKSKVKQKLKPEPFSLESNEDDPELLGPQSTLGTPLTRNDETTKEETNTTVN